MKYAREFQLTSYLYQPAHGTTQIIWFAKVEHPVDVFPWSDGYMSWANLSSSSTNIPFLAPRYRIPPFHSYVGGATLHQFGYIDSYLVIIFLHIFSDEPAR
jgi:hypothetical protein